MLVRFGSCVGLLFWGCLVCIGWLLVCVGLLCFLLAADCGGLVIVIMLLCYFGFVLVICFDGLVCFECGFVSLLIVLDD